MPTTKQPTIKSLQANIKSLKDIIKEKDAQIEALDSRNTDLLDECKDVVKERDMHHMKSHEYKTDAINLTHQLVTTCNELNDIKKKWYYKLFAK